MERQEEQIASAGIKGDDVVIGREESLLWRAANVCHVPRAEPAEIQRRRRVSRERERERQERKGEVNLDTSDPSSSLMFCFPAASYALLTQPHLATWLPFLTSSDLLEKALLRETIHYFPPSLWCNRDGNYI